MCLIVTKNPKTKQPLPPKYTFDTPLKCFKIMRKTYRLKYWLFGKRQYKSLFRQYPYYMGEEQTANFFDQFWYGMDEFLDTGSYIHDGLHSFRTFEDAKKYFDELSWFNKTRSVIVQCSIPINTTYYIGIFDVKYPAYASNRLIMEKVVYAK